MSPVGFDHVAWLWLQGSGQTDSAWFLSALCLSKFSPKLNSGANYESVKLFFFSCTSHETRSLRISKDQKETSCMNSFTLNTEFLEKLNFTALL